MFAFLVHSIHGGIICIFHLFGRFNLGSLGLLRLPCIKLLINSVFNKCVLCNRLYIPSRRFCRMFHRFRSVFDRFCGSLRFYLYIFFAQSVSPPALFLVLFSLIHFLIGTADYIVNAFTVFFVES